MSTYNGYFYRLSLCLLLAGILCGGVQAQELERRIDSLLLDVFADSTGPGGVFLVAKGGQPLFQKAYGKANIELDVNLSQYYVFQLGSITKQFTAVAILLLEEQGKLKVGDAVSQYIPDYPNGDRITLHHLLTHTSGIQDFTKMKTLRDIAQKEMQPREMVDFFKDEPPVFLPGDRFEYNNSGYVVLGYIIELTSGMTYEEYIKTAIFEKIGMNHSRYASNRAIITHRAYGYQVKESEYVNKGHIDFSIPYASGALMSTAGDLLKWQHALTNHVLLGARATEKAFSNYTLNHGEEFAYGYGWHLTEINGSPAREHGGSIFGFKTMGVYIPEHDIYVIGLSNCDCNSPTQVTRDIAALVIAK